MKYDECFYGIPEIKFISHGEHADPEIEYNGLRFNYFEIEEMMNVRYLEDSKGHDCLEDYIGANQNDLFEMLKSMIAARENNNYILGTIGEVVNDYVSRIRSEKINRYIPQLNFKVAEIIEENMTLESILDKNEYMFGIKEIKTGFDNYYGIDLFCDYYGGGYGVYRNLDVDQKECWKKLIYEMFYEVLTDFGYSHENIFQLQLIGEYCHE